MSVKKYLSLERLAEYDALLKAKMAQDDAATLGAAKTYVDTAIADKADAVHVHDERYYTEVEIDTKLSDINTSITNITNGDVVVKEAEHATSADSATSAESAVKATQDGNGAVIADTYETKTDAVAKLTEAKEYVDGKFDGHTHSWNDLSDKPFGGATKYVWSVDNEYEDRVSGAQDYVKVSNDAPDASSFIGGTLHQEADINGEHQTNTQEISEDLIMHIDGAWAIASGMAVVVTAESATIQDVGTFSKGFWVAEMPGAILMEFTGGTVKQLDEKYIPDTIARTSDLDTLSAKVGNVPEGQTVMGIIENIQENAYDDTALVERIAKAETDIGTVSSAVELLTNGVDAETVDGVNDLIQYVNEHGAEVTGMKDEIKANADALAGMSEVAKTGSWNDLLDKPFGEVTTPEQIVIPETTITLRYDEEEERLSYTSESAALLTSFIPTTTYTVTFDGQIMDADVISSTRLDFSDGLRIFLSEDSWTIRDSMDIYASNSTHTISVAQKATVNVTTIKESYIPDTIARTTYVDDKASSTLTTAKNYTDEQIANHTHSYNSLSDKPVGVSKNITEAYVLDYQFNGRRATLGDEINECALFQVSDLPFTVEFDGAVYYAENYTTNEHEDGTDYIITLPTVTLKVCYDYDITWNQVVTTTDGPHTLSVYKGSSEVIQLDEKYIPDTIARTSDIPTVDLTPYETKVDAEGKLAEAKAYTDEVSDALTEYKTAHAGDYTNAQIDEAIKAVSDEVAAIEEISTEEINGLFA